MLYKNEKKNNLDEEVTYWLSIGDLMASILIIFILLFVSKTISSNQDIKKREEIIQVFTSVKTKIIDKIKYEFNKENIVINMDNTTGAIKIDEKILFNSNEYKLKDEGKKYLKQFIPIYARIFIEDENIRKETSQVIIEGHTDDVGTYIYNMELSQKRAFEVLKFIYQEMESFPGKEKFKEVLTANGRSNTKLIKDKNGIIDRDKSRRVEIQFKLRDEEALQKIKKTLEGEKND